MDAEFPWFRFSQDGGNKFLDRCVPELSCGANNGMWINSTIPTEIRASVAINIHIVSNISTCMAHSENALAMRCSGDPNDFVYKYGNQSATHCELGFCVILVKL